MQEINIYMKRSFATATNAKRIKLGLSDEYKKSHSDEFNQGLLFILESEPSLESVINSAPFEQFPIKSSSNHYEHLIKSIISQQIHPTAAKAIEGRLVEHFGHFPTPEEVLDEEDSNLRSVGLSVRKASYLKSVCDHFLNQDLDGYLKDDHTNEEIIERLVEIKGIGEWSAKMFLIFSLQKLDVFAEGDLGIKRGFSYFMETRKHLLKDFNGTLFIKTNKKRNWKTYSDEAMINVSDRYKPYRSVLMLIFWRIAAMDTSSLS